LPATEAPGDATAAKEYIRVAGSPFSLRVIAAAIILLFVYYAQGVVITLVLSILLAYCLDPLVEFLERWAVPRTVASMMIVLLLCAVLGAVIFGWLTDRLGRKLPADIRLTQAPAGSELGDLLERGEIDFMMTANNPLAFRRGSPKVRRLFPNYPEVEKDYYRRTKIYPIMHTVVIRNDIHERNPWVALSVYKALCRAKDHAYHLLADMGSPKVSSAWLQPLLEEERAILGADWFAYGIEANRPSIEALLQYTHEHGLTDRRVTLEELFAPSTLRDIPLSEGQHV